MCVVAPGVEATTSFKVFFSSIGVYVVSKKYKVHRDQCIQTEYGND